VHCAKNQQRQNEQRKQIETAGIEVVHDTTLQPSTRTSCSRLAGRALNAAILASAAAGKPAIEGTGIGFGFLVRIGVLMVLKLM
jgi:hypothetical protein